MNASIATIEAGAEPLTVYVRGDEVVLMSADGARQVLSIDAARATVDRMVDAVAVAQGRTPSKRQLWS